MGKFSENIRKMFGHYDYNHSGSSQTLAAPDWVKCENDMSVIVRGWKIFVNKRYL